MKRLWKARKNDGVIDWSQIRRVLLVRLRSIGDTVLFTPCLTLLKQFRPDLRLTVLSERLAAPLLEGHPLVDDLIPLDRTSNQLSDGAERLRLIRRLRRARFDVAFNMHGGSTATLLCYWSHARYRVGYGGYRYSRLHTHRAPDPELIWRKPIIHSVEQQVGLLKWVGVPMAGIPATSLTVSEPAVETVRERLARLRIRGPFALVHPAATADEKRWATPRFAAVVKYLSAQHDLTSLLLGARNETPLLDNLKHLAGPRAEVFADMSLQEVIALCSMAALFVGNDSGPAHIAMAAECPTVVIFGASNPHVWRPWGETAHAIVTAETDSSGRRLDPTERISFIDVEYVISAIDEVMMKTRHDATRSQRLAPSMRGSMS